ncbi:MAG: DNA-dependent helicase II [Syntrophaceae bacterium PtaB.Bin038]|nr:MAG: DNA-dependent helicase II [Syntrophaceae bacterium PtaB.Bin038]
MATMIPSDVDQFTTDGERQFYRFLERVARPDSRYLSWYLPDIRGKEPDFLLFSDEVGLVIFEVKDWALGQIREADPQYFVLDMGGKTEKRRNPFLQAREYFAEVMNRIKEDGFLLSSDPRFQGKVKIPVNCGVVFPNINKYEYREKGLDRVIDPEKIFFCDDLHPQSDHWADPSGRCFLDALKKMFVPQFSFRVTGKDLERLKALLFPVVRIELPARGAAEKREEDRRRLRVLDHNQEALARKIEGGHRIVTGPSGCGKTLVLVHRAALLTRYNPEIKNILFVCYNITLVNYIKRLLSDKKVPLGEGGVEVMHFFELCAKILNEKVQYEKADPAYYDTVVQLALDKAQASNMKYDAILIDEGQDFSDEMFRTVISLLNKKTDNLMIALDDNQNIYRGGQAWKNLGIRAQGRVHRLNCVYRNTIEIARFAARFMSEGGSETEKPDTKQAELFPDYFDYHGPKPEITQLPDTKAIVDYVATKIKTLTDEGMPLSEIAVLYTVREPYENEKEPLPRLIGHALEKKGILSSWISEDYKAKKSYDITTNRTTISTIQSAKGLDYACVFLLGLDSPKVEGWEPEVAKNLTYVAITRAREELAIPWLRKSHLIERIEKSL